jgi:hypothetical protein
MFYDDSEEKKLFADLQFKRQVQFIDDDDVVAIRLNSFSKISDKYDSFFFPRNNFFTKFYIK